MSVLRGETFEKAGVNISTVFGPISQELKGKIPGSKTAKGFWASGISVVIHPYSPKIPAIHMNTRFIVTGKNWFGGGTDITPNNLNSSNSIKLANYFHNELKGICEKYKKEVITNTKIGVMNIFFFLIETSQEVWEEFFMIT